jgi:hypothetical protein
MATISIRAGVQPLRQPFQICRPATELLHWVRVTVRRYGRKVTLITYINTAGIAMYNGRPGIVAGQTPPQIPALFPIHLTADRLKTDFLPWHTPVV